MMTPEQIVAARDGEWIKAVHDCCSYVSPTAPADVKRCVDVHVSKQVEIPYDQGYPEGGYPVLAVRFTIYELLNLCEALEACGYDGVYHPLTALQSGDWTNCVAVRLRNEINRLGLNTERYAPNQTKEDLRNTAWRLAHVPEKKIQEIVGGQMMGGDDRYCVGYNAGVKKMAWMWKQAQEDQLKRTS